LKRLEYRGYDSVGFATIHEGSVNVRKDRGKIDEVVSNLKMTEMPGTVGVGHTRWATHGAPMMVNAHPHTDCRGQVAVVHNGVIENFQELKEELLARGHNFTSKTDTEVIAHLIEEELGRDVGIEEAIMRATRRLEGSYALAIVTSADPGRIFCARNESPLVLGVSEDGTYCASDVPAMLPYTNRVLYMRNGEFAVLDSGGLRLFRISDGSEVERGLEEITWTLEMAEKQGYPYFMLKEIDEQPKSLRNALRLQRQYLDLLTAFLDRGKELFLVAAGTSYHACIAASYMFSKLARLTAFPAISSEFVAQYGSAIGIDSVVLAVSQSGETYDTLKAVDHARMRAATVLGVTNTIGSSLTRVSRAYLVQQSGPEIGVAATKTFTSQLIVLAQLALRLARVRGKVSQDEVDEFEQRLHNIPDLVERVVEGNRETVRRLAERYADESLFIFLGRGIRDSSSLSLPTYPASPTRPGRASTAP
jgi:glucosamine--fructose-6-phosphate aminotransferase (isomerizing)